MQKTTFSTFSSMNKLAKRKQNERARQYILAYPECSHEELVKSLNYPELSKSYFFNMRGSLRKKGTASIRDFSRNDGGRSKRTQESGRSPLAGIQLEIVDSIDVSGFTEEVRSHYKTHILPMLQRLLPRGKDLQMVSLADPPLIEIRRPLVQGGSKP